MKKILMVSAIAVLTTVMLTGCGDSKEDIQAQAAKLQAACIQEMQKDPLSMGEGKACKAVVKYAKKHNLM